MRASKIIFIYLLLATHMAFAGYEAPNHLISGSSSFAGQGLGLSCHAFDIAADVLPCNPAFIARDRERRLSANAYLGNNVSYVQEAMDLSEGRATTETIQTLFRRKENDEIQAKIEIGYLQETFGWSVTPLQANYQTSFQNQALPEISLYAALEESAKLQFGSYLGRDWSYGIQLRYVHRRFVASRFFLTDALAADGKKIFEPREQHILFIEPGILYAPADHVWNPQFTFYALNTGFTHQKYEEVPTQPQYHLTGSVTPELTYGKIGLGLDLHWDKYVRRGLDPLTLGSFYEIGILRIFGSLARLEQNFGFGVYNTWWNTGIVQKLQSIEDAEGDSIHSRKLYLFLGIEI